MMDSAKDDNFTETIERRVLPYFARGKTWVEKDAVLREYEKAKAEWRERLRYKKLLLEGELKEEESLAIPDVEYCQYIRGKIMILEELLKEMEVKQK